LPFWPVGVALRQFSLKGFIKDLVPILPQEYEQLCTLNPCDDLLLSRRTRDWRLPQFGTHGLPPAALEMLAVSHTPHLLSTQYQPIT
jgi:hypothetical protein